MNRSYKELSKLKTFRERFEYLRLNGSVCNETFGRDRYLNQVLYNSYQWRKIIRPRVILRDNGCDLGCDGHDILPPCPIYIHHINPITIDDIENDDPIVFALDNLICVSFDTHQAIHYGIEPVSAYDYVERSPNDMAPWLL